MSKESTPGGSETRKPELYEASKQKGKPGHCYAAQVFDKAGKSLLVIEPTDDENDASTLAESIADFLNGRAESPSGAKDEIDDEELMKAVFSASVNGMINEVTGSAKDTPNKKSLQETISEEVIERLLKERQSSPVSVDINRELVEAFQNYADRRRDKGNATLKLKAWNNLVFKFDSIKAALSKASSPKSTQ
jgi:hypothetical protein